MWLSQNLKPDIALEFKVINHPEGRVVLLEIPHPNTTPISFKNIPYIRVGSTTPKLTDHPKRMEKLIEKIKPYKWEQGIAASFLKKEELLKLLSYEEYFSLTEQNTPNTTTSILQKLAADCLVSQDVGERWNITNLGAILFAKDLNDFDTSLARKSVRLIVYKGKNKAAQVQNRHDGRLGYAIGFPRLIEYINALLPVNEHITDAFREEQPLFPKLALRELIANALIHQDMTITGTGPQIEIFEDRIEISNPGASLVEPERMIDLPPRSRNEAMAALMRRMRFCEEQGSGIDKVIAQVKLFQLPPPYFKKVEQSTQVILYGPRMFSEMTAEERCRACYQHTVLKWLSNERMRNKTLCERFGIEKQNAAQATSVIKDAVNRNFIKAAVPERPRLGYIPIWV